MNKIAVTFLLGTASAILFSASFLTTDAAGYMDWAKESAPAIHQEMKSFKSSLPFHSIKEDKEGSHGRKDKVKKERKEKDRSPYDEKDGRQRKDRGHDEENRSHDRIHSEAHRQDKRDSQRSVKQDYRKGNPSAPAAPATQETAPMTPEEPQPQTSPDAG